MEEHIEEPTEADKIEIIKGVIEEQEVRIKKLELRLLSVRIIVWGGVAVFVLGPYLKKVFG